MLTDFCTYMYILNARATSKKSVNGLMAKSKKSCFLYAISTYFAFLYIIINSKAEESERKTKKIYLVMWKCDAQIWKLVDNTYTYSFKASTESSAHTLSFFLLFRSFLNCCLVSLSITFFRRHLRRRHKENSAFESSENLHCLQIHLKCTYKNMVHTLSFSRSNSIYSMFHRI